MPDALFLSLTWRCVDRQALLFCTCAVCSPAQLEVESTNNERTMTELMSRMSKQEQLAHKNAEDLAAKQHALAQAKREEENRLKEQLRKREQELKGELRETVEKRQKEAEKLSKKIDNMSRLQEQMLAL